MKAITICQPYAELIARGEKRVENRTWPTSHRGPIAIHAGKSRAWLMTYPDNAQRIRGLNIITPDEMQFGCVIADANLVACVHLSLIHKLDIADPDRFGWLNDHEHVCGPYCWILEDIQRLPEPVPARGYQGLWNFSFSPHGAK